MTVTSHLAADTHNAGTRAVFGHFEAKSAKTLLKKKKVLFVERNKKEKKKEQNYLPECGCNVSAVRRAAHVSGVLLQTQLVL